MGKTLKQMKNSIYSPLCSNIKRLLPFVFLLFLLQRGLAQEITVKRFDLNPIIRPEMLTNGDGEDINGPSLIRVPAWVKNPLGKYYLYFAHHGGKYIRLAYADNLAGPWKIYEKGTLTTESSLYDGDSKLKTSHIASPDIHIDPIKKELVMYFHISPGKLVNEASQVTLRATSKDGIDFQPDNKILGESYFRVFKWDNQFYAMAKFGNLYRSDNGINVFEKGPNPFRNLEAVFGDSHIRHVAVLLRKDVLYAFYSKIGDAPEHIEYSKIHLTKDWNNWEATTPVSLVVPTLEYEGVNIPPKKSVSGASKKPVCELRDPAIFEEAGKVYLLYSVAGELGIAIAEIKINN
jgi:hypothetical protein